MLAKLVLAAAAVTVIGSGAALALTPSAPATYGQVNLAAGFTPDPHTVSLLAGGSLSAANLGPNCAGYITDAPDYKVFYTAGSYALSIGALSSADTTIVVNDPNGNWFCDDDTGDGLNPLLTFATPASGRYDIWVGTFSPGNQSATLRISELGGGPGTGPGGGPVGPGPLDDFPNPGLTPTFGATTLTTGFAPDPVTVNLQAGGSFNAHDVDWACTGFIATAPDYSLTFNPGLLPLIISVAAATDTTLVINDPEGNWICDDDGGDFNLNPSIRFNTPMAGQYDIWVGTYGDTATQPARLHISELTTQ